MSPTTRQETKSLCGEIVSANNARFDGGFREATTSSTFAKRTTMSTVAKRRHRIAVGETDGHGFETRFQPRIRRQVLGLRWMDCDESCRMRHCAICRRIRGSRVMLCVFTVGVFTVGLRRRHPRLLCAAAFAAMTLAKRDSAFSGPE